jgi:hypothetical protein
MSDDDASVRPKRWRRMQFVFVSTALLLVVTAYAWWSYRWIDERFVGAWRVTHNKGGDIHIYVLNRDGSGLRLSQAGSTWHRIYGFKYGWSLSRQGFQFGNNPDYVLQLAHYLMDLGGLRSGGRIRAFRYYGGIPGELVSVTQNRIVLRFPRPGIIKPDELTLTRIPPEDLPDWR